MEEETLTPEQLAALTPEEQEAYRAKQKASCACKQKRKTIATAAGAGLLGFVLARMWR